MSSARRVPPRRPLAEPPEERLRRMYSELQLRHRDLLRKMADNVRVESAFHRLAWFALRRSQSAFALSRDGVVQLANVSWHALAGRHDDGGWIVEDPNDPSDKRRYGDLNTLCDHELARAASPVVTLTAVAARGKRALRVRLERVADRRGSIGLVLVEDISDERARAEELAALRDEAPQRERLRALGRLAAGIVHDLGNTVNAMALRLQVAQRQDGARRQDELEHIRHAIDDMRATLDRLDRFAGRRTAPLSPVDLRAVIAAAVKAVAPELAGDGKPGVRVDVRLPAKLPRVVGHAADLKSVFVNLLVNARDAMAAGGRVTIDGSVDDGSVVVRVADQGPGIAPELLPRLFEPFFSTKGAHGSGLGLALAYGVVASLGGTLRAANGPERGAVFTLSLPRASSVLGRIGVRVDGKHAARLR